MSFSLLAAEGAPNPLLPHTAEIVVGFVAFGLLYMVMRRRVVPMFEKAFAARTEAIQGLSLIHILTLPTKRIV